MKPESFAMKTKLIHEHLTAKIFASPSQMTNEKTKGSSSNNGSAFLVIQKKMKHFSLL